MKLKRYILFITLLILSSCSISEKITTNQDQDTVNKLEIIKRDVELDIQKNVCWINLMPGSERKFNVSGKFEIFKSTKYNFRTTILKYVKVMQKGNEIYLIKPTIIEELTENSKLITFSTLQGLAVNKSLNLAKSVDLEFIFVENDEELLYQLKNIEIEEII